MFLCIKLNSHYSCFVLDYLQHQAYISFRRYCLEANTLPVDLHVVISDILQGAGHVDDILPYFLRHAKQMFPHLECMDDLKKISDLRSPANWLVYFILFCFNNLFFQYSFLKDDFLKLNLLL